MELLMRCPYGHDAKPNVVERKRHDYNRHYQYIQCDECKRVFVHEKTLVQMSSEVDDIVFDQSIFDDGWHEENGVWAGREIMMLTKGE